jgi:hypothetical protein
VLHPVGDPSVDLDVDADGVMARSERQPWDRAGEHPFRSHFVDHVAGDVVHALEDGLDERAVDGEPDADDPNSRRALVAHGDRAPVAGPDGAVRDLDGGEADAAVALAVFALPDVDPRVGLGIVEVPVDHFLDGPLGSQLPVAQIHPGVAERRGSGEVVAHEEHRPTASRHLAHPAEALLLEGEVAHGEHLVDDEDVRLEVRCDGEAEADVHPARVPLDGLVEVFLDTGERDDLVEPSVDLLLRHPEQGPVQIDVLASGQLGVEAGSDLEESADAAGKVHVAGRRLCELGEDLEQR